MPHLEPIKHSYTSDAVAIPSDFLSASTPPSSQLPRPKLTRIDFSTSSVPEYSPCLALILDNVLTPTECASLLHLATLSATTSGGWRPALVGVGAGREILDTEIRHGERLIWDEAEVVDRIWARCLRAEGLKEMIEEWGAGRVGSESVLGAPAVLRGDVWLMTRLNERMQFLRYGRGMFFAGHCDGYITNPHAPPSRPERSHLTLQLYLNSSNDASAGTEPLLGGATSFVSYEDPLQRRLDVAAETGRVLIFQHRDLLHEGQEVVQGVKYTMRTDVMYERVKGETGKVDWRG